jgi:hypothetical protein
MNIQSNRSTTPLRQRMIEDMAARKLGRHSQRHGGPQTRPPFPAQPPL